VGATNGPAQLFGYGFLQPGLSFLKGIHYCTQTEGDMPEMVANQLESHRSESVIHVGKIPGVHSIPIDQHGATITAGTVNRLLQCFS
jgi:hypothetical protein